ncbi:hypothetical protein J3P95_10815 [Pseudomonas sp. Z5-35]|uniref:hypothetical protein n=1 Tax=unclassified Pseudomonas TaxID=196821 RepID=UPI003DA80366
MFVGSRKTPSQIELLGFEQLDQSAHMMEWLRRGRDFRQFIISDLEEELYTQDRGSQLLSAHLKSQPDFETKVLKETSSTQTIVKQFSVVLAFSLRVRASNGVIWVLDVNHGYYAKNMDLPGQFQLRLSFLVMGAQVET